MSANIANDGTRDLFASHREEAWHRLGTVFDHEVTDYREMLSLAGLAGREVRMVPMVTVDGDEVPGFATVSVWPDGARNVYKALGNRYEPLQDETAYSILQSLADGARWETAGALGNGERVFGSIAFERETVLDPSGVADVVKSYALCVNSHDGTSPFLFKKTNVRVVCANTLAVALGDHKGEVKIRHTDTAEERARAAAAIWREANTYDDAFDTAAKALFAAPISDKQYVNLVEAVIGKAPEEDKKGSATKYENKRGVFMQAWKGSPNAGIRGTAWGAFNALTEANQWGRQDRDGSDGFALAGMGLDGPTNRFRQDALTLVTARAGLKMADLLPA